MVSIRFLVPSSCQLSMIFFSPPICDYTLQALAYVFRSQVSCSQSEDIGLSMSGLEKGHFRHWMKWDVAEIGFLKLWIMQSFCIGASEIKKNILKAVNVLSKWALIQFGIIVLYSDFMRYIYIYMTHIHLPVTPC